MVEIYNQNLDPSRLPPLPPIPDKCQNFEAAKDSAFRDDLVTNNGGEKNRGPIPGGAEPSGKGGPSNRATGVDGAGVSCGATWDFGRDGLRITGGQCGVTTHIDGPPGKGYGPGIKWGQSPGQPQSGVKPGVATGDAHGNSVTTADDVKKAGSSSPTSTASSTCSNKSSTPEGLKWVDKNQDLKSAIPPAAAPEINDLGPSTNEPEQKTDAAVAQNDEARFGDDIAQRI
jgi:hypothetical protein